MNCVHYLLTWLLNDNCDLLSQNVLLVPRYKLSGPGRREFRVAGPLVWNFISDCLRDQALELASFKRQLQTSLAIIRHNVFIAL